MLSFLVRRLKHADEVVDAVAFGFLRFALRGVVEVKVKSKVRERRLAETAEGC